MSQADPNGLFSLRIITTILFLSFGISGFFLPHFSLATADSGPEAVPTPRRRAPNRARKVKYSEFPHTIHTEKLKLACDSCHKFPSENWNTVRKETEAFPDVTEFPKHESCLNCHRQQFFKGATPKICSICHKNPSPFDGSRLPFPNPREIFDLSTKGKRAETDFAISFAHDKHIDIVSENRRGRTIFNNASFTRARLAEESCSVCHQIYQPQGDSPDEFVTKPPANLGDAFWLKKGVFRKTAIGHTTCFTCHSTDTGIEPAPTNCAVCHRLKMPQPAGDFDAKMAAAMGIHDKRIMDAWRKRDSSATFRHESDSHVESSCSACHNVMTINTLDAQTKKVKIGSCNVCHITATSDDGGALNFELDSRKTHPAFQCVKCHIAYGKMPVPQSHLDAIAAAAK